MRGWIGGMQDVLTLRTKMDVTVSELLIFSDFHAHNFAYNAKRINVAGRTYNSRLYDALSALKEMQDYAAVNDIKTIVFGGDLFHTRNAVPTDVLSYVYEAIANDTSRRYYLLVGNHDYFDREGFVHSLSIFKYLRHVTVVDRTWLVDNKCATINTHDPVNLVFVPYTDDRELASKWLQQAQETSRHHMKKHEPTLLFAHLGMQGATVGSDYVLVHESDVTVKDVDPSAFTACFFGHFHEHQPLFENGWFIGATTEHNWGDAGGKRGFLHVNVTRDAATFKRIETGAPKFINLSLEDLRAGKTTRDKDFVRIYSNVELTEGLAEEVQKMTKSQHELIYVPPEVQQKVVELPVESLAIDSVIEAWVKAHNAGLDEQELIHLGKKIISVVST